MQKLLKSFISRQGLAVLAGMNIRTSGCSGTQGVGIDQMIHLLDLRLQIVDVVVVGWDHRRDSVGDGNTQSSQCFDLSWIVGDELHALDLQIIEDLWHDVVFADIIGQAQHSVGLDRVISLLLEGIRGDLVGQSNASSFLLEVDHDTRIVLDVFHRVLQLFLAVALLRSKDL